jgi:hypothetical protein
MVACSPSIHFLSCEIDATWGFGLLIAHTFVSVALRVILLGVRTNQMMEGARDAAMSM